MKTVALWVVLIILFVAFYQVFSQPPPAGGVHEPVPTPQWSTIFANWLPIVFLFLFFIFFMRRLQSRHAPTHEGVKLLGQGRYVQALEIFEKYRRAQPNEPAGAFNSASTKLQLWKLDAALVDLEAARKMAKGKVAALAALLPEHLALVQALLGRLGDARQSVQDIPADQADPGRVRLAEAIILVRSGDAAGARAKLSSFEVKQMSGTMGALARTLDAMCIERLTGELRHVDRIALFGETGPEELRKAWPELINFVERAPAW